MDSSKDIDFSIYQGRGMRYMYNVAIVPSTALFLISCVIASSFFVACSPVIKNPHPVPVRSEEEQTYPQQAYKIQVGDALSIKSFYHPELNEELTVRPDGRISLPFAHEVLAAGKTPAELTELLTERYSHEIKNPSITVIIRAFSAQNSYVTGEVNKPQLVPLNGRTTVLQAIAQAGGLKDTARANEIVIVRREADSIPVVIPLDITKVADGTDTRQDILLKPYDIVYVPKSTIANANQWVEQYLRKMLPVNPSGGFSYGF